MPATDAAVTAAGIRLNLPGGVRPLARAGAACLTVHDHDDTFSYQHNAMFTGTLRTDGDVVLEVQRSKETLRLPQRRLRGAEA